MSGLRNNLSVLAVTLFFGGVWCFAQTMTPATVREIFRDSDGNLISNNEFVDIRLANPTYPDYTRIRMLENGTKEFWLQKVPQEGMSAPPFSLTTIDGKRLASNELRGKVVVLNLWFIGCPACLRQDVLLNDVKGKFERSDVVFLSATADPAVDVREYLRKRPSALLHAADADDLIDSFNVKVYPRTMVISREGKIVYWRTTIFATDRLASVVRAELGQ